MEQKGRASPERKVGVVGPFDGGGRSGVGGRGLSPVRGGLARNRSKMRKSAWGSTAAAPPGRQRGHMENLLPEYDPEKKVNGPAKVRRPPKLQGSRSMPRLKPLQGSVSVDSLAYSSAGGVGGIGRMGGTGGMGGGVGGGGGGNDSSLMMLSPTRSPIRASPLPSSPLGSSTRDFGQNLAALPTLETGEDVISYFCKNADSTLIKFKYLNKAKSDREFRPYDLVVVEPNEVRIRSLRGALPAFR